MQNTEEVKEEKKHLIIQEFFFYLYLVEEEINEITNSIMLLDIDEDSKIFKETMSSRYASFQK